MKAVCLGPDLLLNKVQSKLLMHQLLQSMGGVDVTCIEENFVAWSKLGGRLSSAIVVCCHVMLGLHQGCFHIGQGAFHLLLELVDGFKVQRGLVRFNAHPGVVSSVQHEGKLMY